MLAAYVLIAAVTVILVRWLRQFLAYRAVYNNLPGEKDFSWRTGNMHKSPGHNEAGLAYELENARKYKYFHRMWAGPFTPIVLLYHPDSIKPVMKSQAPKPRNEIFASAYDMASRWLGDGLVLSNGNIWFRHRKLLTPAFHFDALKSFLKVFNACTDQGIQKLEKLTANGDRVEIYQYMNQHTFDIILKCAFSYKLSDCAEGTEGTSFVDTLSQIETLWSKRMMRPFHHIEFIYSLTAEGKEFYKLCEKVHTFSDEVIRNRKKQLEENPGLTENKKVKDFLDILLFARDEDGKGMTPLEIRNEVNTFLFAGHDTTASGLTWTLYELAKHPEYQERVYDEVTQILQGNNDVQWDDLTKLEFTSMCIKEAIRLHTTVPLIERHTSEELNINGHKIPIGTRVVFHLYTLHNNPHLWDDAEIYLPDRFHPDKQILMNPFQFVPFSAGSRNCIGQVFAMNEMKTVVAKMIKKFEMTTDRSHKVIQYPTVTMRPETGIFLYLTPRQ